MNFNQILQLLAIANYTKETNKKLCTVLADVEVVYLEHDNPHSVRIIDKFNNATIIRLYTPNQEGGYLQTYHGVFESGIRYSGYDLKEVIINGEKEEKKKLVLDPEETFQLGTVLDSETYKKYCILQELYHHKVDLYFIAFERDGVDYDKVIEDLKKCMN